MADIHPGGAASDPRLLTLSGGMVYMVADNGPSGRELFVAFPGASANSFGHSCASERFGPTLTSSDPVLGGFVQAEGTNASGHVAILLLGAQATQISPVSPGCSFYLKLGGLQVLDTLAVPSSGNWKRRYPLPNQVGFLGIKITLQGAFFNLRGRPHLDLSQGVEWALGK